MNVNATFEGRLTADPELRFLPSGKALTNFTVVTEDRRKNEETQKWEGKDSTFWRCTAFDQMAENVVESLQKGDAVIVMGRIRQRDWQDKDGNNRTSYEVTVNEVGASLRWRTMPHGAGKAERSKPAEDPWATAPVEEPPF
jgi:single-strand DNA-binding protein